MDLNENNKVYSWQRDLFKPQPRLFASAVIINKRQCGRLNLYEVKLHTKNLKVEKQFYTFSFFKQVDRARIFLTEEERKRLID